MAHWVPDKVDTPKYDDSHLPPTGEGTIQELAEAGGFPIKPAHARHAGHGPRKATLVARDLRAIELTAAGASYEQIGRILNLSRVAARSLVERALERRGAEVTARDLPAAKSLQSDRLDALFRRWWPAAIGDPANGIEPSFKAANVVLSIHDRMSRLHGLDAPVQAEIHHTVALSEQEERERRERIVADLQVAAERLDQFRPEAIEGTWQEGS